MERDQPDQLRVGFVLYIRIETMMQEREEESMAKRKCKDETREEIKETNRERWPVSLSCHGGRFDDYDAFLFDVHIKEAKHVYL